MSYMKQLAAEHGQWVGGGPKTSFYTYFEDGYAIQTSMRGEGFQIFEVPQDEVGRLKAIRKFHEVHLQNEIEDFQNFKTETLQQINLHRRYPMNTPSPGPQAIDSLKAGKERVEALQAKLAELDEQIAAAVDAALTSQQKRQRALKQRIHTPHAAELAQRLHQEVLEIDIDVDIDPNITMDRGALA